MNSQLLNWDHQQQYFEQMHLLNTMPSHLSPLSTDSSISNQFYQQPNYQQAHHLMPHNTILEKDNNDFVLIKVCFSFKLNPFESTANESSPTTNFSVYLYQFEKKNSYDNHAAVPLIRQTIRMKID